MPRLSVIAKVVAKKENVERVKSELVKLLMPTRKEDGCIEYNLHQDNENPAVFIFCESWDNLDCLDKHMNSDHFKTYIRAVDGLIEEKVVYKMSRI